MMGWTGSTEWMKKKMINRGIRGDAWVGWGGLFGSCIGRFSSLCFFFFFFFFFFFLVRSFSHMQAAAAEPCPLSPPSHSPQTANPGAPHPPPAPFPGPLS